MTILFVNAPTEAKDYSSFKNERIYSLVVTFFANVTFTTNVIEFYEFILCPFICVKF